MNHEFDPKIRLISVKQINVLNPRQRGKKKFAQIAKNIANLGLKKPITVSHVEGKNGQATYNLVCGQGRLEAYISLGEDEIPALVIQGTKEDLLLMSLAENLARRKHSTVELVREISKLKERGNTNAEIAKKTDLNVTYVGGILKLLAKGEDRLLQAVEKGQIPVSIAVIIATSDDKAVQRALTESYERNDLRGKALLQARRLIENRRSGGKLLRRERKAVKLVPVSADSLLKTYQQETIRQKMVVQKSKICEARLLFATSAIKQLFQDDNFVTLLRAEGLDTLPQYLAAHVFEQGARS